MTTSSATPPAGNVLDLRQVIGALVRKPPVLLGIALETLPVLYLVVYGRGSAAGIVLMAALSLQMITLAGSLRVGLLHAPIFTALATLSCVAAGRPLAAAALALAVALWASLGTASGKGALVSMPASIMTVFIVVPPQVAAGPNPHTSRNVLAVLLYAIAASAWGIAIGMLLRRGRTIPQIPAAGWRWGLTQGLLVGVVMAATAAYATSRHLGQGGAWLLMTVFLVFKPMTPAPWRKSINRAFGTMLGVAVVALYLLTLPSSAPALALLLPAALMLAAAALNLLAQRWPYWTFVALFTPAIVLLLAGTTVTTKTVPIARQLDALRIEYSLLGILIALVVQGLLVAASSFLRVEERSSTFAARRDAPGGS
jgi:hypothetical protein